MEAADGTTRGEGKGIAAWPHFPRADNRQNISAWKHTERMETPLQPAWDHFGTPGHQSASGAEPTPELVATYLVHHFRAFSQTFGLFLSCKANVVLLPFSDTSHNYSSHRAFLPSPTTQQCYRNWKLDQKKTTKQPGWEVDLSSSAPAAIVVPSSALAAGTGRRACQRDAALQWRWHLIGFCLVPGLIISFLLSSCCRKNQQCSEMMITGKNYECLLRHQESFHPSILTEIEKCFCTCLICTILWLPAVQHQERLMFELTMSILLPCLSNASYSPT